VYKMIKRSSLKKPKAAIYIRVSTEEQAKEGYSLNAQESALKDYVGMMGYDIYKVYRDEGKSAKDMKHRPALQQLLKDAEKKYFKAICVYKLDRFSRSLKDLILTIEQLKKLDIDFISLQDKIETASASGKLMFHIISSFAEFERDIISERTRFGMAEKAKEGGVITKAPLGYTIQEGKLVVDITKSKVINEIFKTYVETDKSLNEIARMYNLSVVGLIKLLQNRTYIGEIRFKDNYNGTHEVILDRVLFDKVQDKLRVNTQKREYTKYKNIILELLGKDHDKEFASQMVDKIANNELILIRTVIELEPPTPEILEKVSKKDPLRYYAFEILREEGFSEDEIYFDRMFINADKPDVCGINDDKRVYIDCSLDNISKLYQYLDEETEYRIIKNLEKPVIYSFRKKD
jgi:DNA invertase Pin-like site-specific DNA recombinase